MQQEIKYLYYDLKLPPRDSRELVAIPMYMYRIETFDFKKGLNFFQNMVLKFKAGPDIDVATIHDCTGLNEKLIHVIIGELQSLKLLDSNGFVTKEGHKILDEEDGYIIDPQKVKHGYVFQFPDTGKFYPIYMDTLLQTSALYNKGQVKLNVSKGLEWGETYPEDLLLINNSPKVCRQPKEREIIEIIDHTMDISSENMPSPESLPSTTDLRLKWSSPELVYVCTYIYLSRSKENESYYDDEWKVKDPFGHNDSIILSSYLKQIDNRDFVSYIDSKFQQLPKLNEKKIEEGIDTDDDLAEKELYKAFGGKWLDLNKINLKILLKGISRSYIKMKASKFADYYSSDVFVSSLQRVFETILDYDRDNRPDTYRKIDQTYYPDNRSPNYYGVGRVRKSKVRYLYKTKIRKNAELPGFLHGVAGVDNPTPALKSRLVALFLTTEYESASEMVLLFDSYIDAITYCTEELERNKEAHGYSESKGIMVSIDEECANKAYNYIMEFINKYLNIA